MMVMQRISTMDPHCSHLLHKTILMQKVIADADSHPLHKNHQEAEEPKDNDYYGMRKECTLLQSNSHTRMRRKLKN